MRLSRLSGYVGLASVEVQPRAAGKTVSRFVLFYDCLVKFLLVNAAFNLTNKDWKQYESECVSMHA